MNYYLIINICKGCLALSLIVLFFGLGYGFGTGQYDLAKVIKGNPPANCTNMTFSESIRCLNTDFSSWFKYNLSQVGKTLSEADLKAFGGVCSQASDWYVDKSIALGFNGKIISFGSNVSRYCILDQEILVGCIDLDTISGGSGGHAIALLWN